MISGGTNLANNYVSHFQYYINGDTTIGNYSYFKLYRTGVDSIIPINSGSPTASSSNYYTGALREDNTKKFYFIYQGQSMEYMLFDFNLTVGSYLQDNQGNNQCNSPALMVQSYDTVYLGTIPLKRFYMDNSTIKCIIEGVGSEGGLIEQGSMCLLFESYSTLICYKTDYNRLSVNSNYSCTLPNNSSNCQAAFTYTTNGDISSFANSSTADDSIIAIRWDFNDGTPFYWDINNPDHVFVNPTGYPCLHIQTSKGCQSQTCDTIIVNETGITESLKANSFSISPNPFSAQTSLNLKQALNHATITICNSYGQHVKELKNVSGQAITLYRDSLPIGLYFIHVSQDNKLIATGKLVITNN